MDFLIKKKGILIFILSQRPKNNLQQHLKGQASKSPPPSPKNQHPSGFGAGYPRAPLLSRPQPNLPGLGLLVAFSIPFFFGRIRRFPGRDGVKGCSVVHAGTRLV